MQKTEDSLIETIASNGSEAIDTIQWLVQVVFGFATSMLVLMIGVYIFYNAVMTVFGFMLPAYKDTRFGNFVEKQTNQVNPRILLNEALNELGYTSRDIKNIKLANHRQQYILVGVSKEDVIQRLLLLLSECIVRFDYSILYGIETPHNSEYYIDTMSASLDENYLASMSKIALFQLSEREKNSPPIDFVLAPKTGNVLLARNLAKKMNAKCIYRKSDGNNSRARIGGHDDPNQIYKDQNVNIEGLFSLRKHGLEISRALYGICIDCNCSGGSEIARTIQEYNKTADMYPDQLQYMHEAFVLYRPDQTHITKNCQDGKKIEIKRLFDLSEDDKKILASKNHRNIKNLSRRISLHDYES